ncbi:cell envelope protein SmpA [Pseudomonas sp. LP_7_YM]|uniref:cell envelope protein SmpA n=1 Tax=Pseudomonas sp. LP_7_YM TaxID=2485137 RepID=UPI00105BFEF7|nr:cell envelope protein SmpA [Pseudomonas sp. LP_7_YM]TDV63334.1 hypothetical protein EC915_10697 [Pseudomonas sp. LP_7_YM]
MPLDLRKTVITALLLPATFGATTVNRCEDALGAITFTTLSCPSGHARTPHSVNNALVGTIAPSSAAAESLKKPLKPELVVIGQRDDGCGNILSAEQRRKAIINQQTPAGMTSRDVESLLGKPDKVIGRNAELRFLYEEKKGRSRQIQFDEHGCVKGTQQKERSKK